MDLYFSSTRYLRYIIHYFKLPLSLHFFLYKLRKLNKRITTILEIALEIILDHDKRRYCTFKLKSINEIFHYQVHKISLNYSSSRKLIYIVQGCIFMKPKIMQIHYTVVDSIQLDYMEQNSIYVNINVIYIIIHNRNTKINCNRKDDFKSVKILSKTSK